MLPMRTGYQVDGVPMERRLQVGDQTEELGVPLARFAPEFIHDVCLRWFLAEFFVARVFLGSAKPAQSCPGPKTVPDVCRAVKLGN